MASKVLFGNTCTIDTLTLLAIGGAGGDEGALAFDAAGNLWFGSEGGGSEGLNVIPVASGTLFGVSVTANAVNSMASLVGASQQVGGVAIDASGNVWYGNSGEGLNVIPVASGTLFGVSVTANTANLISSSSEFSTAYGLAFDTAGNLYCAAGTTHLTVMPVASGTLFGVSVTVNTPKNLISGFTNLTGIAIDPTGNLWGADPGADDICVVPKASGTIFGSSVTANTKTAIVTGVSNTYGVILDAAGNLYWQNDAGGAIYVMAASSGTIFGTSVTANTGTAITGTTTNTVFTGYAFDSAGDLFALDANNDGLYALPAASSQGSLSVPQMQPGPTWLDTFKPFWPKPRPPVTPSSPQNYVLLTQPFEEGTSGTTLATSSTSGPGANALDFASAGSGGGVCAFSSAQVAHGALAALVTEGSSGSSYFGWSTSLGTQTLLYGRAYICLVTLPSAATSVVWFVNGASTLARIQIDNNAQLTVKDTTTSTISAFATTLPVGQWFRLEWNLSFPGYAAAYSDVRLYLAADSLTPTEEQITGASQNFDSLQVSQVRFGWNGDGTASAYFDDVGLSGAGPMGPVNPYNFSDVPQLQPGPAWRHQFKTLKPPAPPSGPYFGNLPNKSDVREILPGTTWLDNFKPGLVKPRPQVPDLGQQPGGSVGLAPMGMSATCNVSPWFDASPALAPMKMAATAKAGNIATASMALAPMKMAATDIEDFNAVAHPALAPMAMSGSIYQALPFPQAILQLKLELLINGTWTDISSYVQQRANIVVTSGRADETTTAQPCQMTLTLNNRDGRFTPRNPYGAYYGYIGLNTEIRLSAPTTVIQEELTYRFSGEVSEWPPLWDQTGNDVYVQLVASGILRRLNQSSESNVGSTLFNYYDSLDDATMPVAWWPCTDASGSSQFASGLPDGDAMTWTGTPSLAADSTSFPGSDPVAQFDGSTWTGDTDSFGSSGDDIFSTPGTFSWTAPGGLTEVVCRCWAGGGGGADGPDADDAGGGGGGGEYAEETTLAVTPGTAYTLVVGAGGADNTAGGNTTFTGDSKTVTAHAGQGGDGTEGGGGGHGSTNAVHYNGGSGADGVSAGGTYAPESQNFDSSTSWDAPSTLVDGEVTAYVWGAGGGGGGGAGGGSPNGGGGGAGGNFNFGTIGVTASSSYTVSIGAGGDGGENGPGSAGGASAFTGDSQTVEAWGGNGGAHGGTGGAPSSTGSPYTDGGYGGTGSSSSPYKGGGGGGGASLGGDGGNGGTPGGGAGGNSGGLENGGAGASGATTNGGNGVGANNLAAGGGGSSGDDSTGGHGATGQVTLAWTEETSSSSAGPGGGGGGSGGYTQTGNGGSDPAGATAVDGGGAGGQGGSGSNGFSPGAGPGGGGGGGDAESGSSPYLGGNGYAGQVELVYTPSTTPNANVFRFLLNVNSSGEVDGTVVAEMFTGGTVHKLELVYHTAGTGSLELIGYNSGGSSIFDSGSQNFGANGLPMMVSIELGTSGSDVTWLLTALAVGDSSVIATYDGSVAGSIGSVSQVVMNPGGGLTQTSCGQITVQYELVSLTSLSGVLSAYEGELASVRFLRLCGENGITGSLVGSDDDTGQMGPQQNQPLLTLFQQVEDFDRGLLFEPRDALGLSYRTLVNMQGQNPVATLDYSSSELANGMQPTYDDEYIRNDVTVTRINGSSSRQYLATGSMSVLPPPNGVGDYVFTISVNAFEDSQLSGISSWILAVGTVDDVRYPVVPIDMSRSEMEAIFTSVVTVDVGDFFEITTPPDWLPTGPLLQLAYGFTETLNAFVYQIQWNAVPEAPYEST
jgi:hypothetical protein